MFIGSAKYPLVHIAKALDVLEQDLLFGSDIGCSLRKTVAASSIGPELGICHKFVVYMNLFPSRAPKFYVIPRWEGTCEAR